MQGTCLHVDYTTCTYGTVTRSGTTAINHCRHAFTSASPAVMCRLVSHNVYGNLLKAAVLLKLPLCLHNDVDVCLLHHHVLLALCVFVHGRATLTDRKLVLRVQRIFG